MYTLWAYSVPLFMGPAAQVRSSPEQVEEGRALLSQELQNRQALCFLESLCPLASGLPSFLFFPLSSCISSKRAQEASWRHNTEGEGCSQQILSPCFSISHCFHISPFGIIGTTWQPTRMVSVPFLL